MELPISGNRRFNLSNEEKARLEGFQKAFPLVIDDEELKYITSQTLYDEVCWDIGPWVARVLDVPDCGKLRILCNQKEVPFTTDQIDCDDTALISSERSFKFPKLETQSLSYFDVSYKICQTDTSSTPHRNVTCGGHGCAGYFRGNFALLFDGADWLGKSPAVSKRLKDYFSDNGFDLKIINKAYQTEAHNCAMFSAVSVFLMLVYGELFFYYHMQTLSNVAKNKLIESTAIKIREIAVPLPFNLTLFFRDGSTMQISCDENAKTRSSRDALKRKAVRIVVPKGVTEIAKNAFSKCYSLVSITLPEGIRTIGEMAFFECTALVSITLPEGIRTIEPFSFYRCTALTSITLPEGITTIEREIFAECASLVSVTIPKTVRKIGENAFRETNLAAITLPEGLTTIDSGAFYYCTGLASIDIPESVTKIGDFAFWRCESFVSITIPGGVKTIEMMAFKECTSLASINISEGVKTIKAGAFFGCWKLKSVSLPSTLKEIIGSFYDDEPIGAFQQCTVLDSIALPKGMTTIGDFAFYDCESLASIIIPEGVTTIGEEAFRGCTSLSSIILPEDVTKIGARAFAGCRGLKSIIFPSSVEMYGRDILAGCTSLQRIYYAARDTERQADFVGVPRSVTTYLELSYDQAVEHNLAKVGASALRKPDEAVEPNPKRLRTNGALYDWTRGET